MNRDEFLHHYGRQSKSEINRYLDEESVRLMRNDRRILSLYWSFRRARRDAIWVTVCLVGAHAALVWGGVVAAIIALLLMVAPMVLMWERQWQSRQMLRGFTAAVLTGQEDFL